MLYAIAFKGTAVSSPSDPISVSTHPCTPTRVSSPSHTGTKITLTWMDNSETPEETGFQIYFGGELKNVVRGDILTGTGIGMRTAEILGLECGTQYNDIRVIARYFTFASPKSDSSVNVTTSACQVKVEFTKVDIKDDTDTDVGPIRNPGEIRLRYTVGGTTRYYPNSTGTNNIFTGDSRSLNDVINIDSLRTTPLTISVHAEDYGDDPTNMGTVTGTFNGTLPENFGAGTRTLGNSYFNIYYTITVTSPP